MNNENRTLGGSIIKMLEHMRDSEAKEEAEARRQEARRIQEARMLQEERRIQAEVAGAMQAQQNNDPLFQRGDLSQLVNCANKLLESTAMEKKLEDLEERIDRLYSIRLDMHERLKVIENRMEEHFNKGSTVVKVLEKAMEICEDEDDEEEVELTLDPWF